MCAFLRHLLRHLRGPVLVLWDGGRIHRGRALDRLQARCPRLRVERLPAYAPDLNPDEGVWTLAKRGLANGRPDDCPPSRAGSGGPCVAFASRNACSTGASRSLTFPLFCSDCCIFTQTSIVEWWETIQAEPDAAHRMIRMLIKGRLVVTPQEFVPPHFFAFTGTGTVEPFIEAMGLHKVASPSRPAIQVRVGGLLRRAS